MSGETTETPAESTDPNTSVDAKLREFMRDLGAQNSCPECGHVELEKASDTVLASGEAHRVHAVTCPECGFFSATSTLGKTSARGRGAIEWPAGEAPDNRGDGDE